MSRTTIKYDCVLSKCPSLDNGLKPTRLTELLKHIKREECTSAFVQLDDGTILQGFVTVAMSKKIKFDQKELAKLIEQKFDATLDQPQGFHVVNLIGDKFSFYIL